MKQKDWIIYDPRTTNLLCATISSEDGEKWELTKWANMFDLGSAKLKEMIDMGYKTMLDAVGETDYEYCIGRHKFSAEDFEANTYLKDLLNEDASGKKVSPEKEIDREEFEKEIESLVPKSDITHKGGGAPKSLDDLKKGPKEIPNISISICNNLSDVKDSYDKMCDDDKAATAEIERYDDMIKESVKGDY